MNDVPHTASGDAMKLLVVLPQDTAVVETDDRRPHRKIRMSDGECDMCGLPAVGTCVHCMRLPREKDVARSQTCAEGSAARGLAVEGASR